MLFGQNNIGNIIIFDLTQYLLHINFLKGWTEWSRFNQSITIRYRKCHNETFGQIRGVSFKIKSTKNWNNLVMIKDYV
jgi:hypothetical protein